MIIGSGNIVHNLGLIDFQHVDAPAFDWAGEFDAKVKASLLAGDHRSLIHYQDWGESALLAVPRSTIIFP